MDIEFLATAERVLTFSVIYFVYYMAYKGKGQHWWMKVYCLGMALFFFTLPSISAGRRIVGCFKAIEIIILPHLMSIKTRYRQLLICYVFMLAAALFWNSVKSEIVNGRYAGSLTPINYPYVSIFNTEDIHTYRTEVPRLPDEQ